MSFQGLDYNQMGGTYGSDQEDRSERGYTWNAIVDNFVRLFVTGGISIVCMIPAAFGMSIGLMYYRADYLLFSALIGGAIAGPAYGAMYDAALMSYRGYPGRWWKRYVKVFKREWKGCIIPGIVMGLLVAMIINVFNSLIQTGSVPDMMIICIVLLTAVAMCIFTYFWPMKLMLDLNPQQIIKNSWLMTMMHPLKTLGAVVFRLAYYLLMLILYPYSLIFIVLLGDWFPTFMSVRIVYNTMDREMQLDLRYDEALQKEMTDEDGNSNSVDQK